MNIFISWSGDRSHQVAKLLKRWVKSVIQASRPWISSDDIGSGTKWFAEITGQLESTAQGIICVTNANKNSPWILFEAGALSKGLTTSPKVYPLLIDLDTQDVTGPLAQFNHTWANRKPSMYKLVLDINASLPVESRMDNDVLNHVFETFWPEFERRLGEILKDTEPTNPETEERDDDSIMLEMLNAVRGLSKRMSGIEELLPVKTSVDSLNPENSERMGSVHVQLPLAIFIRRQLKKGVSDEDAIKATVLAYPNYPGPRIMNRFREVKAQLDSNNQ